MVESGGGTPADSCASPSAPAPRGATAPTAIDEIVAGVANVRIWGHLGWAENKRRYRRTVLGPFWAAASQAVFVLSIGFLYAGLWKQSISSYLPYLTSGVISWALLSAIFSESSSVFSGASNLLTQMRFNLSTLVAAMVWRNIIVFLHSLLVYLVVALLFQVPVNANTLLLIPGLALLALNGLWGGLLIGMIGVRFRDMQQLFQNIIQILMFVTPVFWSVENVGEQQKIFVLLNPFSHMLSLLRDPLLGQAPSMTAYAVCAGMAVTGFALTIAVLARYRHRVIFWV